MIIDDLPSGSTFVFVANLFTSFFFQFVGFMLTYVLHTSHAGKYGSRAGLGLTLIQYGFYSRRTDDGGGGSDPSGWTAESTDTSQTSPLQSSEDSANQASILMGEVSREWLSFLLMTLGESAFFPKQRFILRTFHRLVPSAIFSGRLLACQALGIVHSRLFGCGGPYLT
jgi:hypothetical protein